MRLLFVIIPKSLNTKRTLIRPFVKSDEDSFVDFMTDSEATKYLLFTDEQKSLQGAKDLLNFILASYESQHPIMALAVVDKDDNYIGSCGAAPLEDSEDVEFYFSVARSKWGSGLATEFSQKLIQHLFEVQKLPRLFASCSGENLRAQKVLQKLGLDYIGEDPRISGSQRYVKTDSYGSDL